MVTIRRAMILVATVLVLSSCTTNSVPSAAEGQPTHVVVMSTPDKTADCANVEKALELAGSLPQVLGSELASTMAPKSIEAFRQDLARSQEHHCAPDAASVTRSAEALAKSWWSGESGVPTALQEALVPPTAAWILSIDPKEQEDARTGIVQTILLYRAANQRTTIVYRSPSIDAFADPALQSEIRRLKSSLIAQGIMVY